MANNARRSLQGHPKRALLSLLAIAAALFLGIGATVAWGNPQGQWTPKLGLDLEGGRQIILQPQVGKGESVNSGQMQQAVDIIRKRVDATGVAEAEVTTLGSDSIVVSIPGDPSEDILNSLAQSSQLAFRAVIASTQISNEQITPTLPTPYTPTPTSTSTASGSATSSASPTASATPTSAASASPTAANAPLPQAFPAATTTATPTPTPTSTSAAASTTAATASATPTASGTATSGAAADTKPKNASDTAWQSQPVAQYWIDTGYVTKGQTYNDLYTAFSCTNNNPAVGPTATQWREAAASAPLNQPSVGCDAANKYLMGPSEVNGSQITDASYGQKTNSAGVATGEIVVNLSFNSAGAKAFGEVSTRLLSLQSPQNQFAIVVDGGVISAPQSQSAITNGQAQISGSFTEDSAKTLADQLKFGALPFSFNQVSSEQISPQLGSDQLKWGLIAGLIGLALVVIYSLFQYRALGLVTVASLGVAALLSYGAVTFLGWANNFRLTMAGVTGLIVAIGITADSFIVYFERVRDEVRIGRPLRAAVQTGWARARRTIIISDAVNFLAAAVLYILSESNVKAFAFTLGLTTIIDLIVVTMFTHPVLTLLSRTQFFGGGHKWSGFDPERLGARTVTYAGRGRVTIADRKAAERKGSDSDADAVAPAGGNA
ncbi:preprotein translocase subunit SecD [Branchiibius hedensis]|uniref:Protein translocase subunit SecD n=1 Tax=Branchiibius hedensis TaxID=672460 RepID=A0A2Y8ZR31_9MICO|nr:protein translocase subunit SecD [Branchiibius hedensis]PWJ24983.1 preprotein translocase subunit SecD [Branchiibius hedensis]SSA33798.1 preprotein translocase subunit SecD [Branchiibius hedensis]